MLSRGEQKRSAKDAMGVPRGHRTGKEMSGGGALFPADPTAANGEPETLHWASTEQTREPAGAQVGARRQPIRKQSDQGTSDNRADPPPGATAEDSCLSRYQVSSTARQIPCPSPRSRSRSLETSMRARRCWWGDVHEGTTPPESSWEGQGTENKLEWVRGGPDTGLKAPCQGRGSLQPDS